jgi:EAL and modified HD-GYP domain-containing signal transduction protein
MVPSVARQPIFDRRLRVWGYELLFRDVSLQRESPATGETATAKVIVDALMDLGLERIVGGALALVNIPRLFVFDRLLLVLPPDRVALELLEDVEVDDQLLEALRSMVGDGYMLVLDDFCFDESVRPLLSLAHVVKIEVAGRPRDELEELIEELGRYPVRLLAEKVETHEEFESCRALGFRYFQGYFFATPRAVDGAALSAGLLSKLHLAMALQDRNLDFEALERAIGHDLALSFRLLHFLNSAFFSLPRRISSVRDGLVLLGEQAIRRWATVVLLAGIEGKPAELVSLSLARARMTELLGGSRGLGSESGCFLAGLFSVLDALTDRPLEQIVDELPLSEDVTVALLHREGPTGEVLARVLAYEQGRFEEAVAPPFDARTLSDAYVDAVTWSRAALGELG